MLTPQSMDILDQEAHENEMLLSRQPHLAQSRSSSHVANNHLITAAGQYDATIKQAASSDATVKKKWDEWAHMIQILAGGEVRERSCFSADPFRTRSRSTFPPRPLRPVAPCHPQYGPCEPPSKTWMIGYRIARGSLTRLGRSLEGMMSDRRSYKRRAVWRMADQAM